MKKLFGLVVVTVVAMMTVSCSKPLPPGEVVEKATNGLISGDIDTYVEAIYLEDSLSKEEKAAERQHSADILKKYFDAVKNGDDEEAKAQLPKHVEIVKEEVVGDTAVVDCELTLESGEIQNLRMKLKKNKDDEWKILDFGETIPTSTVK